MSETILPPCPGCGGKLEQQSAYDRSAGQYTCAGECGWSWPVDRYARLARAVALLRACERLEKTPRHGMEFVITYYESEHGRDSVIDTVQVIYREGHPPARLHYDMVRGDDLADALIALAAVVVSAIYNALAAALHLRPDLVAASPSLAATALLAMLHGAPLAILGYAVADLLLHQAQPEAHPPATITVNSEQTIVAVSDPIARVVAGELTQAQAAAQLGVSRQAIGKRIKKMEATS